MSHSHAKLAEVIFELKEAMSSQCFKTLMEATAELKKEDDADQLMVVNYLKITLRSPSTHYGITVSSVRKTMIVQTTSLPSEGIPQFLGESFNKDGSFFVNDNGPIMDVGTSYPCKIVTVIESKGCDDEADNVVHYHPSVIILSIAPYKKRAH